jgi:mannosyltransferase OCH1-like enzyme
VIPHTLHQVWVGPEPLPDEFKRYRRSWERRHPGWEVRLWTEENLPPDFRRPEAYERLRVPAERSDIIRLEVLYRFGGVYVDTDFECRRSIEPLIEGVEFFTAFLKPGRVNNAVIGATPGHRILDRALTELRPREFHGYDKHAAGPLFFDRLIKDYPEITIFSPELFYPSTPQQREDAYAIHHSARSWKDAEGFRQATLRAEERLDRAQRELEAERRSHEKTRRELTELREKLANGPYRRSFLRSRSR